MVFVLNKNKKPLNPTSNAKARWLLKNGYAVIHKRYPFTIRLKKIIKKPNNKSYRLKVDPGAKTTGLAIVEDSADNARVVFVANLRHKQTIKKRMDQRRVFRRSRRSRKTRYRKPRFDNRTRKRGWLPPSVQSIVDNIMAWAKKLQAICPIDAISVETVRFDTQLMENPNIRGKEYQQGTLYGYELKEYLLYRYSHTCQYCHGESGDNVLEVEHMVSKANGGTNRVKNLTIACHTCNDEKGSLNLEQWLEGLKKERETKLNKTRIKNIEKIVTDGLLTGFRDAAKVNSSRKAVYRGLADYTTDLEVSSGGRTKFNRAERDLPKTHYFDALCVGKSTPAKFNFSSDLRVLEIKATGRGQRKRTNLTKDGFPRSYKPRQKYFFGFQSGDVVKAIIPRGKNKGTWIGRVSCRTSGSFKLTLASGEKRDGINYKYCQLLQRCDGYNYSYKKYNGDSSPRLKAGASSPNKRRFLPTLKSGSFLAE